MHMLCWCGSRQLTPTYEGVVIVQQMIERMHRIDGAVDERILDGDKTAVTWGKVLCALLSFTIGCPRGVEVAEVQEYRSGGVCHANLPISAACESTQDVFLKIELTRRSSSTATMTRTTRVWCESSVHYECKLRRTL